MIFPFLAIRRLLPPPYRLGLGATPSQDIEENKAQKKLANRIHRKISGKGRQGTGEQETRPGLVESDWQVERSCGVTVST